MKVAVLHTNQCFLEKVIKRYKKNWYNIPQLPANFSVAMVLTRLYCFINTRYIIVNTTNRTVGFHSMASMLGIPIVTQDELLNLELPKLSVILKENFKDNLEGLYNLIKNRISMSLKEYIKKYGIKLGIR